MKRLLSCLFLVTAALSATVSCKKDDDSVDIAPPRDYATQYETEKANIEEFLKTHYIKPGSVEDNYNIVFDSVPNPPTQKTIWEQTDYPLQPKQVTFSGVQYTIYYLKLNQGVGDAPNRGDDILVAYKGTLMDKTQTQFDAQPYPQSLLSLGQLILGWQEILPLFKEGVYVDSNPSGPAQFNDYGAGVMFLPSALAYYNNPQASLPAYSSLVFSFKLYRVEDADFDGDGLLNKYELNGTDPDPANFDSDGDGIPNYRDTDDDNDGTPTLLEVTNPATGEVYENYNDIPSCVPGGVKRHLDPSCDDLG